MKMVLSVLTNATIAVVASSSSFACNHRNPKYIKVKTHNIQNGKTSEG